MTDASPLKLPPKAGRDWERIDAFFDAAMMTNQWARRVSVRNNRFEELSRSISTCERSARRLARKTIRHPHLSITSARQ